ncbi:mannanase [Mycena galopus ATCC 62051]|nr:mannanase [Mycena galopus ATCC 62051]
MKRLCNEAHAILGASALASIPQYDQCGGLNYTGETDCAIGLMCLEQNPYYYQCVAGTATTTSTTVSTTSTVKSTTTSHTTTITASSPPSATGFIKTSATRFTLNGKQFVPVGSNAYWPALLGYSNAEIDQAFADIAASGTTVAWGFNEVTSAQGVYFHLWTGSTATVNTGTDGLQRLDYLISSAKSHGIKLLITLTNNWSDFGGIDVYTAQLLGSGQPHDTFYTNPTVVAAYKAYVQAVVTRYATEDTIMAHELAAEISVYIKSLDPNHLVTIGGEGFINDPIPHNFDYPYTYHIGIDFEANLAIDTLDFGTFHLNKSYRPDSWGESGNDIAWGQQWITDHATLMTSADKPAIMEDFGLTYTGTQRATDYATWYATVISTGLTGDFLWQAGSVFNGTETPNDGYAIYPGDPLYTLVQQQRWWRADERSASAENCAILLLYIW